METKYLSAIKDILAKIEEELNYALPSPSTSHWKENSFGFLDNCIDEKFIDMLTLPSKNLISLGGKSWRPLLLVLSSRMIQQKNNDLQDDSIALKLTPLVEFAHTASLIHDDIEDGADTRRGKPAAHITYGIDAAINAGSFLYFQAASSIKELNVSDSEKSAFYELFLTELRLLHLGQAMDILWHRNEEIIPSIEEYTAMVRNKTGTLARLAVKLGVLGGGGTKEEADSLGKIAQDIGVGFQIIDDVIKNVDEAARVMVYFNGDRKVYAKMNSYTNEPEKGTFSFYSENEAVLDQRKDFKPSDIDKFTVVIWLEGDDPDCTDNLLGGEIKMHMEIREEYKETNE